MMQDHSLADRAKTQGDIETLMAPVNVQTLSGILRYARWRLALPHSDAQPALLWITRGHSRVTTTGRTRGLGPNSAVFLPAHIPWSFDPGPNVQATLTHLPTTPLAPFPTRPHILRVRELEKQAELTALTEGIANPGADLGKPRVQLANCVLLSAWVDRQSPPGPHQKRDRRSRLAYDFTMEVERTLHEGLTLADIGLRLGVTPTHLTRTMRVTCAQTAASYLHDRVMHEARRRLADTDESAAEISRALGFSSPAYFSRAFSAHAGQPPGAFRNPEIDRVAWRA